MKTIILTASQTKDAVTLLQSGELVALPTETVYGLAADATNESAVKKIFQAKQRPCDHPLIVHIDSFDRVKDWADEIPESAARLAKHFWPGPLTMVLKKKPLVSNLVTGGLETVALRVPNHELTLEVIKMLGKGIAAPSANAHKRTSPTSPEHVLKTLSGKIAAVVDGGPCQVGVESTIVDLTTSTPRILRPGEVTASMIESVLGVKVAEKAKDWERVPGNMEIHYQPEKPLFLMSLEQIEEQLKIDQGAAVMHYSELEGLDIKNAYKMPSDKAGYAQALYQTLYTIDGTDAYKILVQAPPSTSEWADVNDRLEKARWK